MDLHERSQSVEEWLALLTVKHIATYIPPRPLTNFSPRILNTRSTAIATRTGNRLPSRQSLTLGTDYRQLQTFLALGKWQEADRETEQLMLRIGNREQEGWLRVEDIQKFPATELGIIDQLWMKHSNGRFGFSTQKFIWQSIGGNQQANYQTFCRFGELVGWRINETWVSYEQFTFDQRIAPAGHLPSGYVFCEVGWWVGLLNLFYRN